NNFVTNGYISKETLKLISPYLDAADVDLKSFKEEFYKKMCGARLQPVLDNLKLMKEMGIWVEVTTLIISTLNDSDDELEEIANFIFSLGKETPWHLSRFYPHYKLTDLPPTPVETLHRAREIGKKAGLNYVYSGNVPGDEGENTFCPNCGEVVISRYGFQTVENRLKQGKCQDCGAKIAGIGM
ncbi:MAG: radical SAM protein, partial [Candidatus Omnitrophica bacterium]|nr:radical SAM protein [Candidatus Omnitrophota bacterium]